MLKGRALTIKRQTSVIHEMTSLPQRERLAVLA